jgi:hypothetical protein
MNYIVITTLYFDISETKRTGLVLGVIFGCPQRSDNE